MAQPSKTQAIAAFLKAKTHQDLAALYNQNMECQVNVAQDGGSPIQAEYKGKLFRGYTDGIQTWKPLRIPWNAASSPEFNDTAMAFSLEEHAEGIGMTGWDWRNKFSRWVAYDFDAITGHSDKHQKKLTDQQLLDIRTSLNEIEWVTLRRSTSGKGLHLYVFLDPVITQNHTEHAALARAILGKLSALTKSDLEGKVDICGQNFWIWHRKMTKESEGLQLLKRGTTLKDIPIQWKDHIKVVSGHRRKALPKFLESEENKFNELTNQATRTQLDDSHKALILYLEERATGSWWDSDHHMLVTHTYWLKKAHQDLSFRGKFETDSAGTEAPNDINVYAFPILRGGWAVRRYSLGVAEHQSWTQDNRGWTKCNYNADPTLSSAARMTGGIEDPSNNSYVFTAANDALEALRLLGGTVTEIPQAIRSEKTVVKPNKDGRVIVEIEGDKQGVFQKDDAMAGWLFKKGKWIKAFSINNGQQSDVEILASEDQVRHLTTSGGEDAGWSLRGDTGDWHGEPLVHVQSALHSVGLKSNEIKQVVGNSVLRAWKLVNRPFQPEYPGDRTWNRHAAQLRFIPTQNDTHHYPHWKMILDHVGSSLDSTIQANGWARNNGLTTGADYLKLWMASLFKEPLQPLPYLFLYSTQQNTGKSIFHEALSLLFTKGYVRADAALINQSGFNGELANAVLCVVEELNLRREKNALNRIKDWVTAPQISIHAKGQTPYQIANSTHWIQTSNESTACPVLPGDTRITSIYVSGFDDITQMIPKKEMFGYLEREACDFLGELLSLEIPPSNDRLNVPVMRTSEKASLEDFNRSPVEVFLSEKVYQVDGEMVLYGELYEQFVASLDPSEAVGWTKQKFGRELPPNFPKARSRKTGAHCVGNLSFNRPLETDAKKPRLVATALDERDMTFLEEVK